MSRVSPPGGLVLPPDLRFAVDPETDVLESSLVGGGGAAVLICCGAAADPVGSGGGAYPARCL